MEKNIYMGCGPDIREEFIHCDIRKFEHVDIVCKAWELSFHMMEVNHIYSRHMLEHLTNFEADRTLRDWFKALKTNGTIRIIVPDMDFHCRQWLDSDWNEETIKNNMSDAKHSFAGFWGWQAECDPWSENYNTTYWDVHKSGYNEKRIKFLLERIGFVDVKTEVKNKWHLIAEATKPKYSGERQVGTNLDEIRKDHLNRYIFASKYIHKQSAIITDGACGVGYGSYVLAKNKNTEVVQSLDISNDALMHAKEHFNHKKIKFMQKDLENEDLDELEKADYYISFETIEHLPTPEKYIEKVSKSIKSDGVFIGSTPNEEIMPFIQQNFLFHTKHFTQKELREILNRHGFTKVEFFQQKRGEPANIEKIENGEYIIFVAKK
jgi:predicted SAM-dependent methyltransferase/2-polyprenyl-3-methyl-5-hydroxy-6-metoxy-1,4-benzoquinol methylase